MNEQKVMNLLNKHITNDNLVKAVALATAANPAAGLAVSIVGGLIVRAVVAAKDYQDSTLQMALVPPVPRHRLTTDESLAFLEENGLTEAFAKQIHNAVPANKPEDYHIYDDEVCHAATFLKKAKDLDDPIFHAFFFGYINHGNLMAIWNNRELFWRFRDQLKLASEPAEFKTMAEAIWDELSGTESRQEIADQLEGPVKKYIKDIVGSVDIKAIVKAIGIGG